MWSVLIGPKGDLVGMQLRGSQPPSGIRHLGSSKYHSHSIDCDETWSVDEGKWCSTFCSVIRAQKSSSALVHVKARSQLLRDLFPPPCGVFSAPAPPGAVVLASARPVPRLTALAVRAMMDYLDLSFAISDMLCMEGGWARLRVRQSGPVSA